LSYRDVGCQLRAAAASKKAGFKADGETFFQFLLTVFAVSLTLNSIGHLLAAAAPNGQVAGILGGVIVALFNIFK
jgi:ABC-type multidrug transport system permease subunit